MPIGPMLSQICNLVLRHHRREQHVVSFASRSRFALSGRTTLTMEMHSYISRTSKSSLCAMSLFQFAPYGLLRNCAAHPGASVSAVVSNRWSLEDERRVFERYRAIRKLERRTRVM